MSVNCVGSNNSGNSAFSTAATVVTTGAGAALGSALTTKYAAPGIINFAKSTATADTFMTSQAKKAVDAVKKNPDATQEQVAKAFNGASEKAQDVYKNLKKFKITDIAQKAATYAKEHPTRTAAIGAAVVGGIGALIGCAVGNKSNESVSSFQG